MKIYFEKMISNILILNTNFLSLLKNNDFQFNFDFVKFFYEKKNSLKKKIFKKNFFEKIKNNKIWFSYFSKIDNFNQILKKLFFFIKSDFLFQNHKNNLFSILKSRNFSFNEKIEKNEKRLKISKKIFFNVNLLLRDTKSVKKCLINFFYEFQDIFFLNEKNFSQKIFFYNNIKKKLILVEKKLDIFFKNLNEEIFDINQNLNLIITNKN